MSAIDRTWYIKRCAVSAAMGILCDLALLLLAALLTVKGVISEAYTEQCVWGITALSAFFAAALCGRKTAKKLLLTTLASAIFYAEIILIGLLLCDTISAARALFLLVPSMLGGGAALTAFGSGKRKRRSAGEHKAKRHVRR